MPSKFDIIKKNLPAHAKMLRRAMGKTARPKTLAEARKVIKRLEGMVKRERLKAKVRRAVGNAAKKVQSKLKK